MKLTCVNTKTKWKITQFSDKLHKQLPDRLMVGHRPLEASILVRIQVRQPFVACAPQGLRPYYKVDEGTELSRAKWYYFHVSYSDYILECADKSLYVGCTNNLDRRLSQHNNSRWGAHYTKTRRPVVLKYQETFKTLKEARGREAEIKGWTRAKKEALINL
jgi:putative endonuclease